MTAIGRNDPCPCGSGRKYKLCCLAQDTSPLQERQSGASWAAAALAIANKYYEAGRMQQAQGVYQVVLEGSPDHPEALHMLGLVALQAEESDSAIAFLERAVRAEPANPAFHSNLGLAYVAAGRIDDGIASWRTSLKIDPEFSEAHNNLAYALTGRGALNEAIVHLRKAVSIAPDYFLAHENLGNALRSQGKPYEAMICYQKAIEIQPGNAHAHYNLGTALSDFGVLEEAAASYRRALALDRGLVEGYNSLGIVLMEMGRIDEAIASIRSALALRPDFPEAHFHLHSLLLDARALGPAISCLRKVIELTPADTLARFHLGVVLDCAGDSESAADQFRLVSKGIPLDRANLDAYEYLKSANAELPPIVGTPIQAFRVGIEAAVVEGLVLEFGVRFGVSIRQIAALVGDREVHGFDSFEGLPEAWHREPRGSYTTMGVMPAVPENVFLHEGWFEHTLPAFMEQHRAPVRLMNIDCDIYSSTHTVLELLAERIVPGSILVFDEYFGHEHWRDDEFRAFHDAAARHGWSYEYLCFSFSTGQVVVRMK